MAELNKGALTSENNNSFPNNNTGFITPTLLRTFNGNMIDSLVDEVTYNLDSASFSSSIAQLKNFSSSLDNTYATDAQLSASASTLQNNINSLSASVTLTVNSLSSSIAATDLAQSSSIAALQVFSSSLDATFATDAQLSASASTLQNEINLKVNISQTSSMSVLSSSYALSASYAGNVPETASYSISSSQAITASFLLGSIESASYAVSASQATTASFLLGSIASASYAETSSFALTASFAENAENINVIVEDIYTGEAITKGDPLYISGSQGAKAIVYRADAAVPTKMPVTYIASETIGAGADSRGIVLGLIEGLNLTGYIAGDSVYVAEGGGWSTSRPTGSNSITQLLGVVTKGGNGGKGLVLNPGPATLPNLESGHLWIGNGTNQPTPQTVSELGLATTGSNTFVGNQIISGNLLVTGSNINLEVDAPALSVGVTNLKTILDATASGVVTSADITRLGAGPTGDLSGIRLQTLSGSDTTGDTLLSRISTGVNRHTSTAMTGSVVNTTILSQWATGSAGGRVTYGSTIVANAQSASATLTLQAGAGATLAGGTASLAAGLIRLGSNSAHRIAPTGSFTNITIDTGNNALTGFTMLSGSFAITTPQGSGSFYSNLPITSSGLRINGVALVNDLIISGVFSGNSTLQVTANASVSGNLFVSGVADISSISASKGLSLTGSAPTIVSGSLSGSLVSTLTDIYPSTPQANFIVTLTSASMATLLSTATANPSTLYIVI